MSKLMSDRAASSLELEAEIRRLEGSVRRVPYTWLYLGSLALTALLVVAIPLMYLVEICVVAHYLVRHAYGNWGRQISGSAVIDYLLLYAWPVAIGGVLLFILCRGLFFRRRRLLAQPRTVEPVRCPLLFLLTERIAASLGVPAPATLCLVLEANAAVTLSSKGIELYLGLPLLRSLTVEQLAGIIAHEIGHCANPFVLRLSAVIRRVLEWLEEARSSGEGVDAWIARRRRDLPKGCVIILEFVVIPAKYTASASLWALQQYGIVVSAILSRQQEYEADLYEVRLVGSECACGTLEEMVVNAAAFEVAYAQMQHYAADRRYLDDLVAHIFRVRSSFSKSQIHSLLEADRRAPMRWCATHPSTAERAALARAAADQGIFSCRLPAVLLVPRFSELARELTEEMYRASGVHPDEGSIISSEELERLGKVEEAAYASLSKYFPHGVDLLALVLTLPAQLDTASRTGVPLEWSIRAACIEELTRHFDRLSLASAGRVLIEAGHTVEPDEFELPSSALPVVKSFVERRKREFDRAQERAMDYSRRFVDELCAAVDTRVSQFHDDRGRCDRMMGAFEGICSALPVVRSLHLRIMEADVLLQSVSEPRTEAERRMHAHYVECLQRDLRELGGVLCRVRDPFCPEGVQAPVMQRSLATDLEMLDETCRVVVEVLGWYEQLVVRILSHLVRFLEEPLREPRVDEAQCRKGVSVRGW